MANIKSAKKRVLITEKKTLENRMIKSKMSTLIKKVKTLVSNGEIEAAEKLLPEVVAYIDSASSKGVIHQNNAARKVSSVTKLVNDAKKAA
ncbi:MAG: 30S ribosomal protein S20 [Clostridia bacterium]|nr:30S ribosomal protein S20 [Clostridia bacterium]